jgi:hypothetical protein
VYSSAQYCRVLKALTPVRDSTIMMPRRERITGQSRSKCRQENGSTTRKASDQRRNESVTGGMWPAARRPRMVLPAQHSVVMQSST